MVNESAPSTASVVVALREIAWAIHRKAPDSAGVGPIPTTEIALLKQIIDQPGSTVGELATALGLQQPNTSSAITVLVKRGFVSREKSELDRRVSLIQPTDLGIRSHEAIASEWSSPVEAAIAGLSDHHRAALNAAVEALGALQSTLRRTPDGD